MTAQLPYRNPVLATRCSGGPLPIRLIITSIYDPARGVGPEWWRVDLDTGEKVLARARAPLFEAARALLARGMDPDQRITMRHGPGGPDCFLPIRLGTAARWTVSEPAERSAHFRRWRPGPAGERGGGGEKLGLSEEPDTDQAGDARPRVAEESP